MSGSGTGGVRRFDHAGVVADDLELVTAFFVDLGFELLPGEVARALREP